MGQPQAGSLREAIFRPSNTPSAFCWAEGRRGRRCVTPRQACPRPNGLGRNLRSKTRWFTGFCNSHQVSHFATFFIDARAEISVAESRFKFSQERSHEAVRAHTANGAASADVLFFVIWFLGAIHAGGSLFGHGRRDRASHPPGRRSEATVARAQALRGGSGHEGVLAPPRCLVNAFAGRSARQVSTMILPQVHLRKPCYDFSFL